MKNIKKSIFCILGIFVLCMFSQAAFAQEKVQPKKQVKELKTPKKADKFARPTGNYELLTERLNLYDLLLLDLISKSRKYARFPVIKDQHLPNRFVR